jgi:hypothetical protein
MLSIDAVKAVQRAEDLCDVHVVYLDCDGFTIAHTDAERAEEQAGGRILEECKLHHHIGRLGRPPAENCGLFVVWERNETWEFEPLDADD